MSVDKNGAKSNRELVFDFLRSLLMLFVFLHHFYLSFPGNADYVVYLNPFAELFVGLAGFMVGLIYLYRNKDPYLIRRGFKILLAFYIVALPESVIKAFAADPSAGHILNTAANVLLMLEDPTTINILRFYGIIFILLPLILYFYRRRPIAVIAASVFLFLVSTVVFYAVGAPATDSFFISQTLMLVLQWQLFLVAGLRIGDLYKTKKLDLDKIKRVLMMAAPVALLIQIIWFKNDLTKFPYSFGKFFGTVYLAPLVLWGIFYLYSKIKGGRTDTFLRVVGRNSLSAFVMCELIRITLIKTPLSLFSFRYTEIGSFAYAILLSVILVCVMWGYERFKKFRKAWFAKTFSSSAPESQKQLTVNET